MGGFPQVRFRTFWDVVNIRFRGRNHGSFVTAAKIRRSVTPSAASDALKLCETRMSYCRAE
jgi:hypothetical protein